jgi:hypothetical protein
MFQCNLSFDENFLSRGEAEERIIKEKSEAEARASEEGVFFRPCVAE